MTKAARSPAKVTAFQAECVDFFGEIVQVFGVPRSVGYIYGLLFSSREPLSFSDIVDRLAISKGSGSQGLQLLRELGAVRPVPHSKGELAHDYYGPELGLRSLVGGILGQKIAPTVKNGGERMRRLRELSAEAGDLEEGGFQSERVDQLETWRRQATLVMPVLKILLRSRKR